MENREQANEGQRRERSEGEDMSDRDRIKSLEQQEEKLFGGIQDKIKRVEEMIADCENMRAILERLRQLEPSRPRE